MNQYIGKMLDNRYEILDVIGVVLVFFIHSDITASGYTALTHTTSNYGSV